VSVDVTGDPEALLDLIGFIAEVVAQLDHLLPTFWEKRDRVPEAPGILAEDDALLDRWLRGAESGHVVAVEWDGLASGGPLALIECLVDGGLGEIGADLAAGHGVDIERTALQLFQQNKVSVMENVLALTWLEPAASSTENAEYIPTVFTVMTGGVSGGMRESCGVTFHTPQGEFEVPSPQ
jgi:hypothetical protein